MVLYALWQVSSFIVSPAYDLGLSLILQQKPKESLFAGPCVLLAVSWISPLDKGVRQKETKELLTEWTSIVWLIVESVARTWSCLPTGGIVAGQVSS